MNPLSARISDRPVAAGTLDRRRFLGLSATGVGALALAACGGPATGATTTGTTASGSTATGTDLDFTGVKPAAQISFWSSNPGKSEAVTKSLITAFEAAQSDTKVTLVTAGATYEDIAQKFQTAQVGGTLPDLVLFSDVWWFRYYMQKSIMPLDSLIKAVGIDTTDYRDSLLADYQYGGHQWAIPFARSTPLFYYNKAHFAAAGLPDRAPATWSEFEEWVPKLKGAATGTQHVYQHPAIAGYAGWTFQNNLWGWGGGWSKDWTVTTDSKESVAAVQWIQDSVYKGAWAGVSSKSQADDFSAAAVSATISSTGDLVGILKSAKFEVGVGNLPGGPVSASPVCPTGGAGIGIPVKIPKENQLAAANFLKFLTSPANTVAFSAATGYMPVRKSADITALTAKTPQIKAAINQLGVTRTQDRARTFFPGGDTEMAKSVANVLTQQADVATEMGKLKATLTGIYTKQVQPNV